ncbi:MAG: amidohydrolase family protein, partial [Dehalococcoidia bacterium]|nr:amidohydrolase family protein [Dehalococcoidia bacterium]
MMAGIGALDDFIALGLAPSSGDDRLRLGAVKIVLDGTNGALNPPQPVLNQMVLRAHRARFQVALHAVEEGTLVAGTTALEHALSREPKPHRHRIEHCSVCPPKLLERLRSLNVVIVTQPSFLFHSGERYLATVSESQRPWLYRIGSWLRAGLLVAGSSDAPVVPPDPLPGIYAATTRRAENGQVVLGEEAVTAAEALAMYTTGAAYAGFDEKDRGSIRPGKLADLVLLSADPTAVPAEQIRQIEVERTIIGGIIVWEKTHE